MEGLVNLGNQNFEFYFKYNGKPLQVFEQGSNGVWQILKGSQSTDRT